MLCDTRLVCRFPASRDRLTCLKLIRNSGQRPAAADWHPRVDRYVPEFERCANKPNRAGGAGQLQVISLEAEGREGKFLMGQAINFVP